MEITLIIVVGLVVVTAVGMVGDYLTRTRMAKLSADPKAGAEVNARLERLEQRIHEQDAEISLLKNDVAFTTKLLESKK